MIDPTGPPADMMHLDEEARTLFQDIPDITIPYPLLVVLNSIARWMEDSIDTLDVTDSRKEWLKKELVDDKTLSEFVSELRYIWEIPWKFQVAELLRENALLEERLNIRP